MGMFDSMYDSAGAEWQTKAYDCNLDRYKVGDKLPYMGTDTYQVEVMGAAYWVPPYIDSYATIKNSRLASIHDDRDETLPLLDYHGGWIAKEEA